MEVDIETATANPRKLAMQPHFLEIDFRLDEKSMVYKLTHFSVLGFGFVLFG